MRRSLNTVHGFRPAFRERLPSSASKVGVAPAMKGARQTSCRNPVGENREGTGAAQPLLIFAGTTLGRLVLGENWKLSALPVRMLNGRPEATARIGANVQLLKILLARLLPLSFPVW